MMKKILLFFILLVGLCSCSLVNKNKRTKISVESQLKKENLYGTWKLKNISVYDKTIEVYSIERIGSVNFNEDEVKYCIEDNCKIIKYNIENNKIIYDKNTDFYEEMSVIIEEKNIPTLNLIYQENGLEVINSYVYE